MTTRTQETQQTQTGASPTHIGRSVGALVRAWRSCMPGCDAL
ncbi:hypothetical protein [Thiomonas sp. FB-Cd]|nr:hypothetical protein [Thiomonas sp. FB-Cd]